MPASSHDPIFVPIVRCRYFSVGQLHTVKKPRGVVKGALAIVVKLTQNLAIAKTGPRLHPVLDPLLSLYILSFLPYFSLGVWQH